MKKRIPTLLATMIASALYSQAGAAADLASQCMLGVPSYTRPQVEGDANSLPVTINADNAKGDYPDNAVFTGNVDIEQGNSRLKADEVQLHQKQPPGQSDPVRTVDALGNVHYDDDQVILRGPKAWSNLNTKDTNVWSGDYQMVDRQGRGTADVMKQRGDNRYTILDNGMFTSCLPGSTTWSVVGSEVIQDRQEEVAELWTARFTLGAVPVFSSPYLQLPIGNKRRSGFLIPNAGFGSDDGFSFSLPYYWNIAPNFDATITPHYMSKRGNIMWENEFRYLTHAGAGVAELDYMPSDSQHSDDSGHRWMTYWNHSGVIDQVWRLNADYTKVSDKDYFDDFNSKYGNSTDGYATQKFSAGYFVDNFAATLSTRKFQVLDDGKNSSYYAMPQLDVNFYQNDVGPFDTRLYMQAVKFENTDSDMPEATRVHFEPSINLPLSNRWGSINTEAKLMSTHYDQKHVNWYNNTYGTNLKDSVNRTLPQFKIDGKMVFERDMDWSAGYTQTLEPRVQYLYVPYKDQGKIMEYDSSLLQADYTGLFRDRSYSGLDRIASANQVTTGLTTRVYDDNAVERFNASIGQIYFFKKSRTGDDNFNWENDDDTGSIVWAGDTYWRMTDYWGLRGGMQYDTRLDDFTTGNGAIEYRRDDDRIVQLKYRYASSQYIKTTLTSYSTAQNYRDGISQVGMTASWPIADRWSVVGAYYYDTKMSKTANQMLGLQYNSCCYAISIGYERKINDWDYNKQQSKFDNKIGFNIELRGLSSNYGLGTQKMLRSNILPYQSAL